MLRLTLVLGLFAMAPFAIGCDSSGSGGGGTAGSGATGGTDLGCNEGACVDESVAMQCRTTVAACLANEAPEEQCLVAGLCLFCFECGPGGGGGTGGGGVGGGGGTGGSGSGPFCDEGACVDASVAMQCRTAVAACVANEAPEEQCIAGANILFCDVFWPSDCDGAVCKCSRQNTPCTISCAETGCNQECDGDGVECTVECPNGGCNQECDNGASCTLSCAGGGCKQECESDALSCTKTCTGGNCTDG